MNDKIKEVAYIAGPFRAPNTWLVEQNIRKAEEIAFNLARMGYTYMCPHMNTRFFNGTLTDEYWLAMTMELMLRCDFVVLSQYYYDTSEGTIAEVETAIAYNMPIYYFDSITGDLTDRWTLCPKSEEDDEETK